MYRTCIGWRGRRLLATLIGKHAKVRNCSVSSPDIVCCKLDQRGLIQASGADVSPFLQGLITNDMACLDMRCGVPCMYSLFLNTKGRVLYDLILYHSPLVPNTTPDTYLIECDRDAAEDFTKLISRYKIRKKVNLSIVTQEYDIWAVFPKTLTERTEPVEVYYNLDCKDKAVTDTYDPRLKAFSRRLVLQRGISACNVLDNVQEVSNDEYHRRRFYFGIGEGMKDMPPANALPMDSNAVFMNGVSFNKGCYIGQELTARTHHTGVVRKRLMPVEFDREDHDCESDCTIENGKGKNCGKLRDSRGKYGLAMLRIPDVINKGPLTIKNSKDEVIELKTKLPWWWPKATDPIIKQVLNQAA